MIRTSQDIIMVSVIGLDKLSELRALRTLKGEHKLF